ncbi:MAG: hypothetical protein ACKOCM_08400 [Cyanobacteriota bacterium]
MAPTSPADVDLQRSMALQAGIHLISMAAKALLVLRGAVLLGEVVAGPGRQMISHGHRCETSGSEPS